MQNSFVCCCFSNWPFHVCPKTDFDVNLLSQDDKYWSRRNKNNTAAKRSRDARRLKENQIAVRAAFLERENAALRREVAELRKDCGRSKKIVSLCEAKYGAL